MICSTCNQFFLVPILYGYPTKEMIQQSREDKIVLGGKTIKEESHYCLNCNVAQVVDYTKWF